MNKIVLLLLLVLILPANAHALDLPFIGGDKKDAEGADKAAQEEKKGKTKFLIHFKSGGELATDNYTVTDDNVIVMMPSGAIYLDKKMVSSIEEVAGIEEETIQSIDISSGRPPVRHTPGGMHEAPRPPAEVQGTVPKDDNGHTEQWWQERVNKWKEKKAKAEKDYADAEDSWNQYNGQLSNLGTDAPEYETIRLQDLRGSARVAMDRAQAEVDEADRMLNEELPDEARKAGALPGWVR